MRTLINPPLSSVFLIFFTLAAFTYCKKPQQILSVDEAFAAYVESYTSGSISRNGTVQVKLTPALNQVRTPGEEAGADLFSFKPSVKGRAFWIDEQTLEFRPEQSLQAGQLYEVALELKKLGKVPAEMSTFRFNVKIIDPEYIVKINGLKTQAESKDKMWFSGSILTADAEDSLLVRQILKVEGKYASNEIKWTHDVSGRTHHFSIYDITRTKSTEELGLVWDGKPIGSQQQGSETIEVPAIGVYKVMQIEAVNEETQAVKIRFSAPVSTQTDLRGLITLQPAVSLNFSVTGNEVLAYPQDAVTGAYTVVVHPGVENIWGEKLNKQFSAPIRFDDRKPFVKVLGKGEIIPGSGQLLLPFEAANLKAIDITVIRIFANNIHQFFQVNDIDGSSQLRRVAKPLIQKTIRLDELSNIRLNQSNRYSIDLSTIFTADPGAMYRVTISFRPEYSMYVCKDGMKSGYGEEDDDFYDEDYYSDSGDEESTFWRSYDSYYPFGYNWREEDNPCHKSYYNKERWDSRNIISSNIGILAKRGNDQSMIIVTTDLATAGTLSGVDIEILDYQQQSLFKGRTDGSGMLQFQCTGKPFLLIASKGSDRNYLKLADGNSQQISRFEVSGTEVKKGIKGFIYGERGVWRPGDSLFINFILEDKGQSLPADHPIEFSLYTPQGQLFKKLVSRSGVEGIYSFRLATLPGSPTGNWQAKVKVGGATFQKALKIETIMPNRLKIDLDTKGLSIWKKGEKPSFSLSSAWLFGAPAQELKVSIDATLSRNSEPFPAFKDYHFHNPEASFSPETKVIFEGKLNEKGQLSFSPVIGLEAQAPGMLKAGMLIKVFEPGGAFSSQYESIPYSPFSRYVGLRTPQLKNEWDYLETGKTHLLDVACLTPEGKLSTESTTLTAALYKLEWNWWWDESDDGGNRYTSGNYSTFVKKETLSLKGGKAQWKLNIPKNDWGKYYLMVHDSISGHKTGKVINFDDPYWKASQQGRDDAAALLNFAADKAAYKTGETIQLTIPSSVGGRILISLENGRKVLQTFWIPTQAGQTTFKFKATDEMAPNIFAYVTLLQPHSQTVNDRPVRMYGVIPIDISNPATVLKPKISVAEVVRPEQTFSIKVSEEQGRDMAYTLAIVDEGLLQLTRFKTPNPHASFYAREALGVKTWDLYDQVLGSFAGKYGRILAIGGDEAADRSADANKANRFPPVVRHLGTFYLKKGSTQTHEVKLPPYFGAVRVMVVAAKDAAYGQTEKTLAVRNPLMVYATAPRVLGPSEVVSIPVTVFATEKALKAVKVSLQSNQALEIIGEKTKTIDFESTGERTIYFEAKVKNFIGTAGITALAQAGSIQSKDVINLEVRNPNPPITLTEAFELEAGKEKSSKVTTIGSLATATATLELSTAPPIQLQQRLGYLIAYPHGCIEQTVSAVFPQLYLATLTDLNSAQKAKSEASIKAAILKMRSFQLADGGFAYWPGLRSSDAWGTNYAAHFLLEAKSKGYFVPDEMLTPLLKHLRDKAEKWAIPTQSKNVYSEEITQAYRLYLLSVASAPNLGAMNRLAAFSLLSNESKWRLAMAYKQAGYTTQAADLSRNLPLAISQQDDNGFTYGSALRDKAMILEALTLLNRRREAGMLVNEIAQILSSNEWMSTQTTAFALKSIAAYAGNNKGDQAIKATLKINGKAENLSSQKMVLQVPLDLSKGSLDIDLNNTGGSRLFARIIRSGQPLPDDPSMKLPSSPLIKLNVEYFDMKKNPVDVTQAWQGKDFVMKVTVTHTGQMPIFRNLALNTIFPSGWEIINSRVFDAENGFSSSPFTYQDVRDDRVYTYFDLDKGKTAVFWFMLNSAYAGKYYQPMLHVEAMYDHKISAFSPGRWVNIKP